MTISDYTRHPHRGQAPQAQRDDDPAQRLRPSEPPAAPLAGASSSSSQATRQPGAGLRRSLERVRILTAEALSRAAANLRTPSTTPNAPARRFADSLDRSATYLRQTDVAGMQRDAIELVRQHPLQALGLAFAAGLFIGRRLKRS